MMSNFSKLSGALSIAAVLALGGCSTTGVGIGDAFSALNPFDGGDTDSQGEAIEDTRRISLMALDESLIITGELTPDDVVLPPVYVNADWPQAGGNAVHVLQHTQATGNLSRAWSRTIGKGSSAKGRVVAPPVISGGRLFAMDGDNKVIGLDAGTGSKIWDYKFKLSPRKRTRRGRKSLVERVQNPLNAFGDSGGTDKESVGGGVAVEGDVTYATSGLGLVVALDSQTGAQIWRTETRTPMHGAPAVSNGRLFAVSDDNEMFALNTETGQVLWTYQGITETARFLTAPSPAVIDDVVIAPFASGEIVALRVQNGGVLWQDALSSSGRLTPLSSLNDIAAGPVIADGFVIVTAQSGVMNAFDLRTGQRVWSQPAGSLGYPWVAGDFVYTVTTGGQVVCMSKLDGRVVWINDLPVFQNAKKRKDKIAWAGPILASEKLYLFSSNGLAVEMDPYNGGINREFKAGGNIFVPPVIANETVYLLADNAKLLALR